MTTQNNNGNIHAMVAAAIDKLSEQDADLRRQLDAARRHIHELEQEVEKLQQEKQELHGHLKLEGDARRSLEVLISKVNALVSGRQLDHVVPQHD